MNNITTSRDCSASLACSVGALASYVHNVRRAHETIIRPGDTRDASTVAMYVTADGSVGVATCWASFAQRMTWQP